MVGPLLFLNYSKMNIEQKKEKLELQHFTIVPMDRFFLEIGNYVRLRDDLEDFLYKITDPSSDMYDYAELYMTKYTYQWCIIEDIIITKGTKGVPSIFFYLIDIDIHGSL